MTAGYPNIRKRPDIRYLSNQSPMHQWCGSGIRICIVGNLLDPVRQGGSRSESRRQKWRTICQKCWKLCFKSLNIFYKYVRFFSYKTISVKKKTKNKNYYFPYKHCIKFFLSFRLIIYSLDPDPHGGWCGSTSLQCIQPCWPPAAHWMAVIIVVPPSGLASKHHRGAV